MCFIGPVVKNLKNPFALAADIRLTTNLTMNPSTFPVDVYCHDARRVVSWVTTEKVGGALDTHLLVITLLSMAVRTNRH